MACWIAALTAALAWTGAPAWAQTYPQKAVRVIIPWPPGGGNDIVGRIVAQKLGEITGQPFIVDNRSGATGTIGADFVAKSAPDGYTIMIHSATHVSNAHLYRKLPYDTLKDFVAVAPLSILLGVLVVHPSLPVRSVKELIALAKASPGQVIYGSAGNGSFVHLAMALINVMTGTRMTHVPYKGSGPAIVSIVSGETQVQVAAIGAVTQQMKLNRVRPLAVTSDYRLDAFPQVPTLAEAGIPGYEFTAWSGTFAPAATPKPIVDKLNSDIQKVQRMPAVVATLKNETLDPLIMSPEQFARRLKSDYEKYEKVIRVTGVKID
jgi:tripartite-type tricarboxylate transporter receptor subunit TctC